MTMTMTHSEKSHIHRMKAWPYRQECRGHDPTKKNLFCWCSFARWQGVQVQTVKGQSVSQRDLRWTQYMKHEKQTKATGSCCAEFTNSSQNPQIRSNTTDKTRRHQGARKPEGMKKMARLRQDQGCESTALESLVRVVCELHVEIRFIAGAGEQQLESVTQKRGTIVFHWWTTTPAVTFCRHLDVLETKCDCFPWICRSP